LLVCALSFATPLVEISFTTAAVAGTVRLDPGVYKVKVTGAVAVFTCPVTGKSFTTIVRLEKTNKTSAFTAVIGPVVDGVQRVQSIVTEGSDDRLIFTSR
jgi:hypothetical protein